MENIRTADGVGIPVPTPGETWTPALVGPAKEPVQLGPGDYIAPSLRRAHLVKALEPDTTAVLVMEHT